MIELAFARLDPARSYVPVREAGVYACCFMTPPMVGPFLTESGYVPFPKHPGVWVRG